MCHLFVDARTTETAVNVGSRPPICCATDAINITGRLSPTTINITTTVFARQRTVIHHVFQVAISLLSQRQSIGCRRFEPTGAALQTAPADADCGQ